MAFLRSQPPRQPFLQAPASVLWLIAVLVAVHVTLVLLPENVSDDIYMRFAFLPARYEHGGPLLVLLVPFVSHMFLHGSFVHLGVNCLWLLVCGPLVARRYGTLLFLAFFLACGVAGAAAHLALNWGSEVPVIGASGGIAGLMAAAIRLIRWPNAGVSGPLMPIFSRPILVFSGAWIVTNIVFGILGFGTDGDTLIAWQAHLGGYVGGLFLPDLFEKLRRPPAALPP